MIDLIFDFRPRSLGGVSVGRVLPFRKKRMVGPFVFLDHMLPLSVTPGAPRELDVRPHPHIGLSTVTYLFSGEITHRDSLGFEQEVHPGEVNWMVAGAASPTASASTRLENMERFCTDFRLGWRFQLSKKKRSRPSRTTTVPI